MTRGRGRAAALIAGLAAISAFAAGVAVGAPGPDSSTSESATAMRASAQLSCRSGKARRDREQPCSPALASSPWSMIHAGSYQQDSTSAPGPQPGPTSVQAADTGGVGAPVAISAAYADGGRAAWGFGGDLVTRKVFAVKFDAQTGAVLAQTPLDLDNPGNVSSASGAYALVDHKNRFISARSGEIRIVADTNPGELSSPIAVIERFPLPAKSFCGTGDSIVGLNALPDGRLVTVSAHGVISLLPGKPGSMTAAKVRSASINGDDCANPEAEGFETVSNSVAVDRQGSVYPLTDRAQYRFNLAGKGLERAWRARYRRGRPPGGIRIDSGSGSTPSLMGTRRAEDRFVVITDAQPVMHLDLFWRGRIPKGWERIAPGTPRRLACEFPVDFGDPQLTGSASEQSVVVHGYKAFVPQNELRDDAFLDDPSLGDQQRLLQAALAGNDPDHAPYGVERIDWDPKRQRCKTAWVNQEASIPNGVPAYSSSSRMLYGIGQRDGVWGLLGLDGGTGATQVWVPTSSFAIDNPIYTPLTIGPDASAWTGRLGGASMFRNTSG